MYITFDEIMDYKMKVNRLQAENERLNDKDGLYDEVKELQAELQAVNDDYNNDTKVHNEYADGLLAEIKELKADNVRLVEQVGSNSGNSSSTHTHKRR